MKSNPDPPYYAKCPVFESRLLLSMPFIGCLFVSLVLKASLLIKLFPFSAEIKANFNENVNQRNQNVNNLCRYEQIIANAKLSDLLKVKGTN